MTDMFAYQSDSPTSHVSKVEPGAMTEMAFGYRMGAARFLKLDGRIDGITVEMIGLVTEMVEIVGPEMTPLKSKVMTAAENTNELILAVEFV